MKVTDEELEAMKPTLQALIPYLCDDPEGLDSWCTDGVYQGCTCANPKDYCGNRWECKKRPNAWKKLVREQLKI